MIKMVELSELTKQVKTPKTPQQVWAVENEYPHVITRHNKEFKSEFLTFHNSVESAFEYRRKISSSYLIAHQIRSELDNHRTTHGEVYSR